MKASPKAQGWRAVVRTQFSLFFEGDLLSRLFGRIGVRNRGVIDLGKRIGLVFVLTWLAMAVLAWAQGLYSTRIEASNFFADFAAYAQFWVALPLFIVAESIVSESTREAAKHFLGTGVVRSADLERIEAMHREVRAMRRSWRAELVLIVIAWVLAAATILPEFSGGAITTWHTQVVDPSVRILTLPGAWAMLVALPILNYWWLRFAWKIFIWSRYLYQISRLRLMLVASHPDRTGGIGFVSRVQARFALVIFAYGVSNVAAVFAYKVGIEGADLSLPPVWGPVLGFVIGAPLLFTLPLFMFTKQLHRTKKRALSQYQSQATERARMFEKQWLGIGPKGQDRVEFHDLADLNSFTELYERIHVMRGSAL